MRGEASRDTRAAPGARARRRRGVPGNIGSLAMYGPLVFLAVVALAPAVWMLFSSLKSMGEFYRNPWLWPEEWHWENYARVWVGASFGLYFGNSLIIVFSSVAGEIVVGGMAGYALARYTFRGRESMLYYFISGQIVPAQVVLIPLFIMIRLMGLLNTRQGLFLIYVAAAMPFVVFMMQGFFKGIPRELEEAARIDGAGELRIFWQIMLPLVRPGVGTLAIFQSLAIWNEFLFALVFASKPELRTLTVGIFSIIGRYFADYPLFFAGLTVATLPSVILYVIFSKYLVRGVISGAVKG